MDRDVSNLMMSFLRDNANDDFRYEDDNTRTVLLLDRLLPTIRPTKSSLLSLPTEILADIVE